MAIPPSESASKVLADGTHACRPLVWHETESLGHPTAAYSKLAGSAHCTAVLGGCGEGPCKPLVIL